MPLKIGDLTGQIPPPYRAVYGKVLDGLLRTEMVNGRHYVREDNIPAIAQMFGRHLSAAAA